MDNINTAYDDAFHTLLLYCKTLVIPVVNESFQQVFSGREKIISSESRIYLRQQDGREEKKITDASFTIVSADGISNRFHLECQSTPDNSMLVRIFEYDSQIALQNATLIEDTLEVEFPQSAVLQLRNDKKIKRKLKLVIKTPGGNISYEVPVLNVQEYDLDTIFEKGLYFLLPFYIFRYEKELGSISKDPNKLEDLKRTYIDIEERLEQVKLERKIDEYTKRNILEMSMHVLRKIAAGKDHIIEEVSSVMGGNVLQTEAHTILERGIAQGETIGKLRGTAQKLVENVEALMDTMNLSLENACKALKTSMQEYNNSKALINIEKGD